MERVDAGKEAQRPEHEEEGRLHEGRERRLAGGAHAFEGAPGVERSEHDRDPAKPPHVREPDEVEREGDAGALPPSSGAMVADIAAVTRNTYGAMRKTGVVVVL